MNLKKLFYKVIRSQKSKQFLIDNLHLIVLWSFVFAQPLYDLLGRYADFFVAHRTTPYIIIKLVIFVSILSPLVLVIIEFIAGIVGIRFRRIIHLFFIGILAALIILPPLNRMGGMPTEAIVGTMLVFGSVFVFIYSNWKIVRSFLTIISLAVLIFPIIFLFFTPVKSLVFQKKTAIPIIAEIRNIVPITFIIFDELNTMALLNGKGEIDSVRYPNFAALARESCWFPNAIGPSTETISSVPAILTGQMPLNCDKKLTTYSDHADNIFTLLAGQYYMNVYEAQTSLCPNEYNARSGKIQITSFESDILVIYRTIFYPGLLKKSSDYFGGRWKGFKMSDSNETDEISSVWYSRKLEAKTFISGILEDVKNQLNFMHIELPHVPYEYLSSGKTYNKTTVLPEGITSEDEGWTNSKDLVEVGYQRYLQQVGYADKILGDVIAQLKKQGIYDKSLIIITADHGVSMQPKMSRREYSETNLQDIFKVPTFLKFPDQTASLICSALVSGLDIVPTIAEVLGISVPYKHDGVSMLSLAAAKRISIDINNMATSGVTTLKLNKIIGFNLLAWQDSVYGSGTPLTLLMRRDSHHALLGKDIIDLNVKTDISKVLIEIEDNLGQFKNVDLNGNFLPAYVRGHVIGNVTKTKLLLAIVMNGKVWATTSTTQWLDDPCFFNALLPEAAFRQGNNNLEIYLIQETKQGINPKMIKIPIKGKGDILLKSINGKELLSIENGGEFRIQTKVIKGYLDGFHLMESTVVFKGWAVDYTSGSPVQSVLIFSGKQLVALIKPSIERRDVIASTNTEKSKFSGFQIEVQSNLINAEDIRAFGITNNGKAGELGITDLSKKQILEFLNAKKIIKSTKY
ncbi:MAG: sulfatase-like hydrolase/transferase [Bacteroidota bacterium]